MYYKCKRHNDFEILGSCSPQFAIYEVLTKYATNLNMNSNAETLQHMHHKNKNRTCQNHSFRFEKPVFMCLLKVNIVRLVVNGKRNLGLATSLQWETISARDSWKKIRGAHNQIILLQTHNQVSNGFN